MVFHINKNLGNLCFSGRHKPDQLDLINEYLGNSELHPLANRMLSSANRWAET